MKLKPLHILLFLILVTDSVYSFQQFYHSALDGDVAESVLPTPIMEPLFKDPLGLGLFKNPTPYHNPNRYFSHYSYFQIFNHVPRFFQSFLAPINSIYATAASFKLFIQLLLIFLISMYVQQRGKLKKYNLFFAAFIIISFFQSYGYRTYIGIIDPSISYVFFYAFPIALVLIYYLPLFGKLSFPRQFYKRILFWIFWIFLALIICLSGPLNPGIVLIINLLILINQIFKKSTAQNVLKRLVSLPIDSLLLTIPISFFALYSLYIGSFNAYTLSSDIPLAEMYSKIPEGIYTLWTGKLAWPLITVILAVHYLWLRKKHTNSALMLRHEFKWVAAFSILYILLLPLGGFRDYRPLVLRYDTILPVTLASVYLIGRSTLYLQSKLAGVKKIAHLVIIILILIVFTNADRDHFQHNTCERTALQTLAQAEESPVKIKPSCTLLSWDPILNAEDSNYNAQLLKRWNITQSVILYYQD